MSRFHDEFFRQGSPAHDALMIKCLSKAGIEKILSTVEGYSPAATMSANVKLMVTCAVLTVSIAGVGLGVGAKEGVGLGVGAKVGVGDGVGSIVGVGVGVSPSGSGSGVMPSGVGEGVGVGAKVGVGLGVAANGAVGDGVGAKVGVGVGISDGSMLARTVAVKETLRWLRSSA